MYCIPNVAVLSELFVQIWPNVMYKQFLFVVTFVGNDEEFFDDNHVLVFVKNNFDVCSKDLSDKCIETDFCRSFANQVFDRRVDDVGN